VEASDTNQDQWTDFEGLPKEEKKRSNVWLEAF